MATQFSGGSYVSNSLDGSTKANLIADFQAKLTTAGWSVISGSGTTNLLMQTAQVPTSLNQGRVRFKDNAGNCVQITIENIGGTKAQTLSTSVGGSLFCTAGRVYKILASRYRFEAFILGAPVNRDNVVAGVLYIPTPYQGVVTEAIYMRSNTLGDTDTSGRNSFRTDLGAGTNNGNAGNCAAICNNSLYDHTGGFGSGSYQGDITMRLTSNAVGGTAYNNQTNASYVNCYRWHDLALDTCDPLMAWGTSAGTDEALIRGQVFDWCVLSDSFTVDTTDTWTDQSVSHNWWAYTSSNGGNRDAVRGTIWIATS